MNIVEKYKEQLAILERAQVQALEREEFGEVRCLSTDIYQLCNAITIEEGNKLKQC